MGQQTTNHVLPGETGGDCSWFFRQNAFEQQEIRRQVAFRRRHWPALPNGAWSKRPDYLYPHILPAGNERLAFHLPLADEILGYLERDDIALHSEALNLKSSQVACLNILFPLRRDPALATATFKSLVPDLWAVTGIEFEYTGPAGSTNWLGEPSRGGRGQNRTSIDAAVTWDDTAGHRHIMLIEWKYTERNFGVCSAFTNADSTERKRCLDLDLASAAPPGLACLLVGGSDKRNRRYWEHLSGAGIHKGTLAGVRGCPFAGPLYQLMRQQLLAGYLVQQDVADHADIVILAFAGNTALSDVPRQLAPMRLSKKDTILDVWNRALAGIPPVRHRSVENLLAAVDGTGEADPGWREYVRDRYGV